MSPSPKPWIQSVDYYLKILHWFLIISQISWKEVHDSSVSDTQEHSYATQKLPLKPNCSDCYIVPNTSSVGTVWIDSSFLWINPGFVLSFSSMSSNMTSWQFFNIGRDFVKSLMVHYIERYLLLNLCVSDHKSKHLYFNILFYSTYCNVLISVSHKWSSWEWGDKSSCDDV